MYKQNSYFVIDQKGVVSFYAVKLIEKIISFNEVVQAFLK